MEHEDYGYLKASVEACHNEVVRGFCGINERLDSINGRVRENEKEIARLQVKSGVWGALGGLVAGLAAAFGLGR